MSDYINREGILAEYDRQHKGPPGGARKIMATYPAADVVTRDFYDRVMAENNAMRAQLAKIGKKPGDSIDAPRWISVEDRLPEEGTRCIVILANEAKKVSGIDILWHDAHDLWWNRLYKYSDRYIVTHWMPLPEPPKEGQI